MVTASLFFAGIAAIFWMSFFIFSGFTKHFVSPIRRSETVYRKLTASLLEELDDDELFDSDSDPPKYDMNESNGSPVQEHPTYPLYSS
jgi:hypothetical protein